MKRERIDSHSMKSIGYDARKGHLEIEYPSGDVYRYFEVPPEEYRAFIAAESRGTYLNRVFKPKGYRYANIGRAHPWPKAS